MGTGLGTRKLAAEDNFRAMEVCGGRPGPENNWGGSASAQEIRGTGTGSKEGNAGPGKRPAQAHGNDLPHLETLLNVDPLSPTDPIASRANASPLKGLQIRLIPLIPLIPLPSERSRHRSKFKRASV